ncbi:hypothetical protein VPH35_071751 [Triticum aestivum]
MPLLCHLVSFNAGDVVIVTLLSSRATDHSEWPEVLGTRAPCCNEQREVLDLQRTSCDGLLRRLLAASTPAATVCIRRWNQRVPVLSSAAAMREPARRQAATRLRRVLEPAISGATTGNVGC